MSLVSGTFPRILTCTAEAILPMKAACQILNPLFNIKLEATKKASPAPAVSMAVSVKAGRLSVSSCSP